MQTRIPLFFLISFFSVQLAGATQFVSPYSGEQLRSIKSLSEQDVHDLTLGKGWGLAKAAELNGVPGPLHILEMQDAIHLNDSQRQEVTRLFDAMKDRASQLGKQLVELEANLNSAFANNTVDKDSLKHMLDEIGRVRAELRYTHLSAHLETPSILTPHQIVMYNKLRGYGGNPCDAVPEGHDPTMWKRHNGCE